uniref:ZF-HD dimerization-type domain-containing protein n=1 Tax=Kalanchoe fedtschenkoi TaxID=63787 RepID=A0A7N0TR94_KALFE
MKPNQMLEIGPGPATNQQLVAQTVSYAYQPVSPPHAAEVTAEMIFKECLKNHAAGLGGHALDGCGEFMPAERVGPGLMKCEACGCHRNFHRQAMAAQSHHREPPRSVVGVTPPHFSFMPRRCSSSPSTSTSPHLSQPRQLNPPPQPPPMAVRYLHHHSFGAHMLMPLSTGKSASPPPSTARIKPSDHHQTRRQQNPNPSTRRKRFRSKFSSEQKHRMRRFAEGLNWKIRKHDDTLVARFCADVGVSRGVLKVWMHNNKHTAGQIVPDNPTGSSSGNNGEDEQLQLSNSEHRQQVDEGDDGLGLGVDHHQRHNHPLNTLD